MTMKNDEAICFQYVDDEYYNFTGAKEALDERCIKVEYPLIKEVSDSVREKWLHLGFGTLGLDHEQYDFYSQGIGEPARTAGAVLMMNMEGKVFGKRIVRSIKLVSNSEKSLEQLVKTFNLPFDKTKIKSVFC